MDKFKIGDRAYLKVKSGICFEIKIVDFRQPYGRQLYKIVPIKGTGEAEVEPATLVSKTDKKKNEDR